MKKAILAAVIGLAIATGPAMAERVRDWRDLVKVHEQLKRAIVEMERARAANHYDMAGHGAKAEEHMREAERELHEAIEAAKNAR